MSSPDDDGTFRCHLVELADRLFVGFGAAMIGLTDVDDPARQEGLRQIIPGIEQPDGLPRYGIGFGSGPHACLGCGSSSATTATAAATSG